MVVLTKIRGTASAVSVSVTERSQTTRAVVAFTSDVSAFIAANVLAGIQTDGSVWIEIAPSSISAGYASTASGVASWSGIVAGVTSRGFSASTGGTSATNAERQIRICAISKLCVHGARLTNSLST